MRKVLFLMIMLFLMGLGTASVKAQVRIGANTPPHPTAVLDLNADNVSSTGTKGLALPRVVLTSDTMQLTPGVPNVNGLLVYNNSVNLGPRGMYFWNGAIGRWIQASLPTTTAADSGEILTSNGSSWVPSNMAPPNLPLYPDSLIVHQTGIGFSLNLIVDTSFAFSTTLTWSQSQHIIALNIHPSDVCTATGVDTYTSPAPLSAYAVQSRVVLTNFSRTNLVPGDRVRIRCFRLVS